MTLVGPFQLRMFYESVMCSPCPEQGELSPWGCGEQEVSAHLPPVLLPSRDPRESCGFACWKEKMIWVRQSALSRLPTFFFFSQQQMKGAGCCALGRQR